MDGVALQPLEARHDTYYLRVILDLRIFTFDILDYLNSDHNLAYNYKGP